MSILTHVNAATFDQQTRDNLKRHSYSGNSAMNSIATEVGKLVTDNQLEQTWGDSFARTVNGTSHGFAKRQANQVDLTYILPALAAIAVKNPKKDMWEDLSRGNIRGFTPEQQEHILNAYTIITLFQKLNENGFLVKTGSIEEFYDEVLKANLDDTLNESFRKFGNDSLREKVTLFVTHIFPFAQYIPAIPEPSNLSIHYANVRDFHKSFNPHAARSFASHQPVSPAAEHVAMDPASQMEHFKQAWSAYRQNVLDLQVNRNPDINGYRTIFLRQPKDGKEDQAYHASKQIAEIWKVKGRGDCGFDAVGVPRETFVREILAKWDTDPDIRHTMKNDFKGFLVEWRYQRTSQGRLFFSKKLTDLIEKESIDVLTDHGNNADSVDNMPDADTKEFIMAYYLEKGDFANATAQAENNGDGFIASSQAQEDGVRHADVWRPEAGALKALAKIRGVNLRLWKRIDDRSAPVKFAQKRDLDFKILYQNMTEEELREKIKTTEYSQNELQRIQNARNGPKASVQELNDLIEELEFSLYPWSSIIIHKDLPTLNILNGGMHYDVILPEGDIEGFPHAFHNEISSSKASHPECSREIDGKVTELLEEYPAVKKLMNGHKEILEPQPDFGKIFKEINTIPNISDIIESEERMAIFNTRLVGEEIPEKISISDLTKRTQHAWKWAVHKTEFPNLITQARLEAYARAYLRDMGLNVE
jgi:histidinol phosphatase-like enzyme